MADSRVPALTELAEAPASGDLLHLVDVSDTTDHASGSSKKITTANLVSSNADVAANTAARHTRSHAVTSTSDHTAGNHKTFYSNGSGNVTELTHGDTGKVLTSNGATSAPSWETPSGGGGGSMDDFTLAGDAGTPQTIADGNTLTVAGGTGIDTTAGSSDTVTVGLDSATQASLALADSAVQDLSDLSITATATELNYTDGVTSAIQTQLNTKAADADVVHDTGNETIAGIKTFSSDPLIPDEAYGVGWNGSLEPPTKNAVYDKIETMGSSGVDTANSPNANEFARFTDADTIEGRTASEVKADLDLEIGTDLQAYDADLTTIAGLTATTDNFIQSKASAWASRTPTQVTADLTAMVGDSGSGGTKGLVPAPGSGDAAANKYLKADGTWATVSASGSVATDTIFDAKGDLAVGTGSNTAAKLTAGTNTYVLTADSGESTGLKWAAPSGGSSTPRAVRYFEPLSTVFWNDATGSGGTITYDDGGYTRLNTGTTSGGNVGLAPAANRAHISKGTIFRKIHGSVGLGVSGASGNGNAYFHFLSNNATASTMTADQVGYKMIKSSGTITTSASNGDGTTETATAVNGSFSVAITNSLVLNVVSNDGTDNKFYEAGTLLATHTTNLQGNTSSDFYQYPMSMLVNNASSTDVFVLDFMFGSLTYEMY